MTGLGHEVTGSLGRYPGPVDPMLVEAAICERHVTITNACSVVYVVEKTGQWTSVPR